MKKTAIDRAIESLENEKAVLELAIFKLKTQKAGAVAKRKPRPVEKASA